MSRKKGAARQGEKRGFLEANFISSGLFRRDFFKKVALLHQKETERKEEDEEGREKDISSKLFYVSSVSFVWLKVEKRNGTLLKRIFLYAICILYGWNNERQRRHDRTFLENCISVTRFWVKCSYPVWLYLAIFGGKVPG